MYITLYVYHLLYVYDENGKNNNTASCTIIILQCVSLQVVVFAAPLCCEKKKRSILPQSVIRYIYYYIGKYVMHTIIHQFCIKYIYL